jgi:hypothetical protein
MDLTLLRDVDPAPELSLNLSTVWRDKYIGPKDVRRLKSPEPESLWQRELLTLHATISKTRHRPYIT